MGQFGNGKKRIEDDDDDDDEDDAEGERYRSTTMGGLQTRPEGLGWLTRVFESRRPCLHGKGSGAGRIGYTNLAPTSKHAPMLFALTISARAQVSAYAICRLKKMSIKSPSAKLVSVSKEMPPSDTS